jgi:azurin
MYKIVSSMIIATLILSSCGTDDNVEVDKKEVQEVQKEKTKEVSNEEVNLDSEVSEVEIILSSNDQMRYDKSEIIVEEGQKVTLILKHTGTMEKTAMGHNFVLLALDTDIPSFAEKAVAASENGYIPEGDEVIAYTDVIGGGETTSVTFIAPEEGVYDFICSFPGHYGMMKGKFIVE